MDFQKTFPGIVQAGAPLGARTCFQTGGPAEFLAAPTNREELVELIKSCRDSSTPFRVLGGGSNSLIPDEGFPGLVIELTHPSFEEISIESPLVTVGAGRSLADLISEACRAGLSGLEPLVGVPGTVGGAIAKNAGGRTGDIGQFLHSLEILDATGAMETRARSNIRLGYRHSDLDDVVILSATFQLIPDASEDIVRRIKKIWIEKKAHQPFDFQRAGYAFRNSRGQSVAELVDKAGLRGTKVGGAELSDRDPHYVIAAMNATSRDVRQLIELVINRVEAETGVRLDLQVDIW